MAIVPPDFGPHNRAELGDGWTGYEIQPAGHNWVDCWSACVHRIETQYTLRDTEVTIGYVSGKGWHLHANRHGEDRAIQDMGMPWFETWQEAVVYLEMVKD